MKVNKILNVLTGYRCDLSLHKKWWHRFFNVGLFLASPLILLIFFGVFVNVVPRTLFNASSISLEAYTKEQSLDVVNTVDGFLDLSGELACYNPDENGFTRLSYLDEVVMRDRVLCNPDWVANADILSDYGDGMKQKPLDFFVTDLTNLYNEERVCTSTEWAVSLGCSADNIVKWSNGTVFWLEVLFYDVLASVSFLILILNFYYRGFVYIVMGAKKI